MRRIHVEDGLSLRFPRREAEFNEGVEIGLIAAGLAARRREFTLRLADATLDQARSLAEGFGYRLHVHPLDDGSSEVVFLFGRRRPQLRLVHSQASCA